jgi:endonuclease/exonuclease/phosphatase (EEP) superfamily protein YafD
MNTVLVVGPGRDTGRPLPVGQGLLLTVAGLALVPAVPTTLMRLVPPTDDATALAASFIAFGAIPYAVALLCLLVALIRARRRPALAIVTGIVALLTALHLAWLGPLYVPDQRATRTEPFTVMTLNMFVGRADPAVVVDMGQRADIVILAEVTPAAVRALQSRAWYKRFPYSVGSSEDGVGGTAVYSRFRLSRAELIGPTEFQQWAVMVDVPGAGPVRLLAVHPCNPYCGGGRWHSDHQLIRDAVAEDLVTPTIVAGDFNAVEDHGPMQQLRRLGLRSASDIVGAGWQPTYPAGRRLVPPLLPIDHVLVNDRRLTATSVTAHNVPGTDHRGLLVTLAGT